VDFVQLAISNDRLELAKCDFIRTDYNQIFVFRRRAILNRQAGETGGKEQDKLH
jgi:hypothetical protein